MEIGGSCYETSTRHCRRRRRATGRGFFRSIPGRMAVGAGSSGYGRDPWYVQDAKIIALRTCERRSPIPVCTIAWCRPGMR